MTKTLLLASALLLAASTTQSFARGGQFGPIGPGSREGLQPSVNTPRPDAFAYEPQRAAPAIRARKAKRK